MKNIIKYRFLLRWTHTEKESESEIKGEELNVHNFYGLFNISHKGFFPVHDILLNTSMHAKVVQP